MSIFVERIINGGFLCFTPKTAIIMVRDGNHIKRNVSKPRVDNSIFFYGTLQTCLKRA